ncbi:MAG: DUF3791 domain-containing protein [Treponema sp.]
MMAHPILLQKKYTRIVILYAEKKHISLEESLKVFYNSTTYQLMRVGASDMHCMSDGYLVEEIEMEEKE